MIRERKRSQKQKIDKGKYQRKEMLIGRRKGLRQGIECKCLEIDKEGI